MEGDRYGLRRSSYYVSESGKHLAQVVALACEGPVWQRTWGIGVGPDGKPVEVRAPHVPPPPGAWMGDYSIPGVTKDMVDTMMLGVIVGHNHPCRDGVWMLNEDFQVITPN